LANLVPAPELFSTIHALAEALGEQTSRDRRSAPTHFPG
jgi:hypothetical protein